MDDGVWFGALGGEFGADAELLHDVTETVEAGVVIEVGLAGEFLDFLAGDDKFIAILGDLSGVFEGVFA